MVSSSSCDVLQLTRVCSDPGPSCVRSFDGWYNVCWRVSCYFPGITLLALTVLNLLIHHTGSSGAIPLGAFFSLVSLWFVVSIPLCYSGAASLVATPPNSHLWVGATVEVLWSHFLSGQQLRIG